MKLRAEIRISTKFYRDGENVPIAVSENIDPIVEIMGDDLEGVLKRVAHMGDVFKKILDIHGKKNTEPQIIHREVEIVRGYICSN